MLVNILNSKEMSNKNLCFSCKKAFSTDVNFNEIKESKCPECGKIMTKVSHRFRPPKKTDDKKWEIVKYLVEHGFVYQHIYEKVYVNSNGTLSYENYAEYPENIKDAIDFVEKYKNQVNK